MKTLHHLGPSPEHAQYQAIVPEFWEKVQQQEAQAIKLGLPAQGMFEFGQRWMRAWNTQDIDLLRDCMTPDCGFVDSSTFQNTRVGREETLANCAACFEAFPDMCFYPQDASIRSLPYADYFEGQWRMVIPWRGIARWTGPQRLPGTDVVFPPTGKNLNFIGVDRYVLTEDFRISHIDTDWDMAFMGIQLSPVGVPVPSMGVLKAVALAARVVVPPLRFLGRNSTPDGHRRFDLELPTIARPEDWADGAEKVADALTQFRSRLSA